MIDLSLEDAGAVYTLDRTRKPTRITPLEIERGVRVAQFIAEHLGRHSSHKFVGLDLVHITPNPAFSRLDGANQRMLGFVKMLGGMLVL
jgi:hypothetical protein